MKIDSQIRHCPATQSSPLACHDCGLSCFDTWCATSRQSPVAEARRAWSHEKPFSAHFLHPLIWPVEEFCGLKAHLLHSLVPSRYSSAMLYIIPLPDGGEMCVTAFGIEIALTEWLHLCQSKGRSYSTKCGTEKEVACVLLSTGIVVVFIHLK